ncbi:MAG TPA: type IV secretion system protein VirB10, partial [Stellaceae bacterium]|nr:type IV secretion system protein VirB10 [Stellaceae bacterium]
VGERGTSSVNAARSLQSRVSNLLAMGLMSTLGLGLLGWYYAHTWAHQTEVKKAAQAASRNQAAGEMALPSLGKIDPPASPIAHVLGSPPPPPPTETDPNGAAAGVSSGAAAAGMAPGSPYPGSTQPPTKPAWQVALERRLAGPVSAGPAVIKEASSTPSVGEAKAPAGSDEVGSSSAETPLSAHLRPSATPAAHARVLPAQRLLLPKGAFIDCTLETAIDSTLPGMTTCVTATDTFGVDGSTVLIERGSKLVGETRGDVQQGQARVFVLWTEARTPTGVIVPLASPGTDELGRSGLPGDVNRHFFQRFGAAILVSIIEGAVQGAVASQSRGGTVIYNPSASTDVVTDVLKSTVNIPPTITKPQGDRIQVFVARDLDFRSVYELRTNRVRAP